MPNEVCNICWPNTFSHHFFAKNLTTRHFYTTFARWTTSVCPMNFLSQTTRGTLFKTFALRTYPLGKYLIFYNIESLLLLPCAASFSSSLFSIPLFICSLSLCRCGLSLSLTVRTFSPWALSSPIIKVMFAHLFHYINCMCDGFMKFVKIVGILWKL